MKKYLIVATNAENIEMQVRNELAENITSLCEKEISMYKEYDSISAENLSDMEFLQMVLKENVDCLEGEIVHCGSSMGTPEGTFRYGGGDMDATEWESVKIIEMPKETIEEAAKVLCEYCGCDFTECEKCQVNRLAESAYIEAEPDDPNCD